MKVSPQAGGRKEMQNTGGHIFGLGKNEDEGGKKIKERRRGMGVGGDGTDTYCKMASPHL